MGDPGVAAGAGDDRVGGVLGDGLDVGGSDDQFEGCGAVRAGGGDGVDSAVDGAVLMMNRAVEAVESLAAFLGVRGAQRPQQRRYLLGRAVRVLHRRPVDVMKSVEHDQNHARRH
ncbi:hypothetical protein GCM10023086_67160 [Streptomyces venetus]|uniref:Uncharacterized protein n=1 Tax=Streptomyces venetus TaxID=1701086 RepID=A0ABP8H6E9_9ACTN